MLTLGFFFLLRCQLFLTFAVLLFLLPFLKVVHTLFFALLLFLRDQLLPNVFTESDAEVDFEVFVVRPFLILPLSLVCLRKASEELFAHFFNSLLLCSRMLTVLVVRIAFALVT